MMPEKDTAAVSFCKSELRVLPKTGTTRTRMGENIDSRKIRHDGRATLRILQETRR